MARSASFNGWAFIAFPVFIIFLFAALPTVIGIGLSFFEWTGGGTPRFIGGQNYIDLAASTPFGPALRNTLIIAITTVPITVVFAFLFAVALNASWFPGRTVARVLFFTPTIISIVAIGFIWRWVLSPTDAGLLNYALMELGVLNGPRDWLGNNAGGLTTLIVVSIWRGIGFSVVLYLAALNTVPRSLYDAAAVDGAGSWHAMWRITWPSVRPMTFFLLITGMIGGLQVFDLVLVMIGEAHQPWTDVLNLYLYREFTQDRLGFAAAIGVVILALTVVVTALQLWRLQAGEGEGAAA